MGSRATPGLCSAGLMLRAALAGLLVLRGVCDDPPSNVTAAATAESGGSPGCADRTCCLGRREDVEQRSGMKTECRIRRVCAHSNGARRHGIRAGESLTRP